MVENRLKFDRDVLAHGSDDYEDYDDWDPWLDLDEEDHEVLLRKLHAHMDSNLDGYVDIEELVVWCLVAMFNINGHDASEDWEFTVMNEDTSLMSYEDVIDELYTHRFDTDTSSDTADDTFNADSTMFKEYNRNYNRDKARFTASDLNGDEMLDKTEWILFNNPLKDAAIKDATIEEALGAVDTNIDGKLSLDEYLADWREKPNYLSEVDEKHMTNMFTNDYDRDQNGFLEGDELLFWIHEDNAQNAVDEADHLMDMCDDDEDGKLSPQEIVNEADEWIESAGTEYGQTLRWMEDL